MDEDLKTQVQKLIEEQRQKERLTPAQKWDVAVIFGAVTTVAVAVLALGGQPVVKEAARLTAERVASDRLGQTLLNDPNFISEIRGDTSLIPRDAVVAFDRSGGCPPGWTNFVDAFGRVIIGAGDPSSSPFPNGSDNIALARKGFRETSGSETHKLTTGEMPSHTHAISTGYSIDSQIDWHDGLAGNTLRSGNPNQPVTGIDHYFNNQDPKIQRGGGHGVLDRVLEAVGGNQPHDNMQPYIALYLCKKES